MRTVKGRIFAYLAGFALVFATLFGVVSWSLGETHRAVESLANDRVNALKYVKATSDALAIRIVDQAQKAITDREVTFPAAAAVVAESRAVARDQCAASSIRPISRLSSMTRSGGAHADCSDAVRFAKSPACRTFLKPAIRPRWTDSFARGSTRRSIR